MKKYLTVLLFLSIVAKGRVTAQDIETISPADSIIIEKYKESFKEASSLKPLVDRYKKKRQKRVNKKVLFFAGHEDAYSIFFDADKLKRIITDAIKVTESRGTSYCGLRFYYAVYDRNYEHKAPLPPCIPSTGEKMSDNYGLMHTLVIVPVEYDPKTKTMRDIKIGKKIMVMMTEPENNGTLCPPPHPICNGQTF